MLLNLDIGNPEVEFMDFKEFKVVGVVKILLINLQ